MRLTKTDMARVVVTALHNKKDALVAADHPEVVRKVRTLTVDQLKHQHKLAMAAINSTRDLA